MVSGVGPELGVGIPHPANDLRHICNFFIPTGERTQSSSTSERRLEALPREEDFQCRDWPTLADEFVEYCAVPDVDGECDLQLSLLMTDVNGIPTAGKSQIIVAVVDHVLHFRIFNGDGKVVVDTNEKRLTEQAPKIEVFRKLLESLWLSQSLPGARRTRSSPLSHQSSVTLRMVYTSWAAFRRMRRFTPNSERAFNLIWALIEFGAIETGTNTGGRRRRARWNHCRGRRAVEGRKGDAFREGVETPSPPDRAHHRYVHPNYYDSPKEHFDQSETPLPLLNLKAGTCDRVICIKNRMAQ